MVSGLLMELEDRNCWTLAEAAGHRGPTGCTGRPGDDATSTALAKPTNAGASTPKQHHDHNELQLP
jgi:hypothetical protein